MKAALYDQVGTPEVLYIADVEEAQAGPNQAVVQVEAAGVNPYDSKVLSGFIPLKAQFPRRIGSDLAGRVIAVGDEALYWDGQPIQVGDAVMGRGKGSFAQQSVAQASGLTKIPQGLDAEVAASMNVPALTANSLLNTVEVSPGDTVLVGGATGAVGMLAAQLAKLKGARVIGTAGASNFSFLEDLGIEPVKYGEGLAQRVEELCADKGPVTVVFDCHGREALDAGLELGVPASQMAAIAAYEALEELGVNNVEFATRTAENLAGLAQLAADGDLVLPVVGTYSLEEVSEAFKAVDGRHAPGKIVVKP